MLSSCFPCLLAACAQLEQICGVGRRSLFLYTFSFLMRSLSPMTSCLRDLGVPIDLKLPEVSATKFQLCKCDALSFLHAQRPPLVSAPPVEAESVVPPVQP